jgi:hypothetical protein
MDALLSFKCEDCKHEFMKPDPGESLTNCPCCGGESHYTEYYEEVKKR